MNDEANALRFEFRSFNIIENLQFCNLVNDTTVSLIKKCVGYLVSLIRDIQVGVLVLKYVEINWNSKLIKVKFTKQEHLL